MQMLDRKSKLIGQRLMKPSLILLSSFIALAASSAGYAQSESAGALQFDDPSEQRMNENAKSHQRLGEIFRTMAKQFPDEYRSFISSLTKNYSFESAYEYMQGFMALQKANIERAPSSNISALIENQFQFASRLSEIDQGLCAHFTMKGGFRATDRLPQELDALLLENTILRLNAAAAGRDTPVTAMEPSDQDWMALLEAMPALTDVEQSHLFSGTTDQLPEDQECKIGLGLYSALSKMNRESAVKIMRSI